MLLPERSYRFLTQLLILIFIIFVWIFNRFAAIKIPDTECQTRVLATQALL
jgi:hypothetical protein